MDVTIKSIPDGITEAQVIQVVGNLITRYYDDNIGKLPDVAKINEDAKIAALPAVIQLKMEAIPAFNQAVIEAKAGIVKFHKDNESKTLIEPKAE